MTRFLVIRLLQTAAVLAVMSFVIYALIGLMPGDPIDVMIASNPHLTAADAIRLKALYGLDRPLIERYGAWAQAALAGDFGYSRLYVRPVGRGAAAAARQHRALLMGASFVLALGLALMLGIAAARRPGGWFDRAVNLAAFCLHLGAVVLAGAHADSGVRGGAGRAAGGRHRDRRRRRLGRPGCATWCCRWRHLTLASMGGHLRYMRAAMIETLRQDYIRTARAKGAGELRVLLGHALRNALIPVITVVALSFGSLFSGALVTETMFAYPGMGKLIYDAVMGNDFNLALAGLLLATAMTLLANLAADIAYAAADPRISYR